LPPTVRYMSGMAVKHLTVLARIRRHSLKVGVILAGFAAMSGLLVVQNQREASAEQGFQAARAALLAEESHATTDGLGADEFSDVVRQEKDLSSRTAPSAGPLSSEARIDFFSSQRHQEVRLRHALISQERQARAVARATAAELAARAASLVARGRELGVDADLLAAPATLVAAGSADLSAAVSVRDFRHVVSELKASTEQLAMLSAEQEASNAQIANFVSLAAAADNGDPGLAAAAASAILAQTQTDLLTARLFRMDVSIIDSRVQKLALKLPTMHEAKDLDQITGALTLQDHLLQQAMSANLPEKALTISLNEQVLRAFEHGHQVFWTYVTTGRPGLETVTGTFKVYWKVAPWIFHSPWPKGSPYWYPDSKSNLVMWFYSGYAIHDAPWRAYYGPGTQFAHYDPLGENVGTHGCVNVPHQNMVWLWNWTPTSTPVVVY
jgi:lipoprotein-anchoring transpeptidase ErfK/SrfK